MYLKRGYVITSRGCPNRCWFCSAWKREGDLRELPITEGHNVLDDNLLACSEEHIRAVFAMLRGQRARAAFTGGLEAARLRPWMARELADLNPRPIYFAYDEPRDLEPLRQAVGILRENGFRVERHLVRCYVLCGYPGDTFERAEARFREVMGLGIDPMAMLWRDETGGRDREWARFQRNWVRPALMHQRCTSAGPSRPQP